jgi:hypothetical protein
MQTSSTAVVRVPLDATFRFPSHQAAKGPDFVAVDAFAPNGARITLHVEGASGRRFHTATRVALAAGGEGGVFLSVAGSWERSAATRSARTHWTLVVSDWDLVPDDVPA